MKKLLLVFLLNLFQHVAFATCTPVSITTQPQNQNDSIPGHAHFTVDVSGTAPYNYYWYVNGVLTDSTINSALATNTYNTPSLTMADSNNTYYCIITNCAGANTITSNTVHLVCIPVSITVQPLSQTLTAGNVATISFSVTVSGTPPFTYKWYKNGSTLVKTTTDTLGSTSVYSFNANPVVYGMNGWNYHVVVTNCHTGIGSGGGNQATSGNAVITVGCPTISAPVIYPSQTFLCLNSTAGIYLNSNVILSGTSFNWTGSDGFSSTNNNPYDGFFVSTLSPIIFSLIISENGCSSPPGYLTLDVYSSPYITNPPTNQTICSGGTISYIPNIIFNGPPFHVFGDSYAHSNSPNIIGFSNANLGNINEVLFNTGTTSASVTYFIYPFDGCSGQSYSFSVTVNPEPVVNVTSASTCAGQTAILTASGASTYTWSAGATSTGTNTASASPPATHTYTITGTNSYGCSNTTTSTVTVNPSFAINDNETFCNGSQYLWHGTNYTSAGNYTANYTTINGCDSIYTLHLTTNTDSTSLNIASCTSYILNSQTYSTSGTYSQLLTNSNGCDSLITLNLTISPPAPSQPSSILGITHVCDGSSTAYGVINDSAATSYTWSLPPTWSGSSDSCLITATADSLGGVITVIANNGCGSSPPQSINVYGSARPVVTLSPLGTVCENLLPFPLTNGNPLGGTYSGTGENSNIFYPYVAGVGTYYITYTYISGACTVSDSVPITVDLCLNVTSNTEESNGITISPNPFTSETTITFNKEQFSTNIKVIDVTGREIKKLEQTMHNTTHTTLDIRGYAKGVYIVQITDDNKNTTNKKVIIE